jgi:hypothetical protein
MAGSESFRAARDLLLARRSEYADAVRDFRWPELEEFNWGSTGSTPSAPKATGRRSGSSTPEEASSASRSQS